MPYTKWNEEEVQRRISLKYGEGVLKDYIEWIKEGDFPPKKGFHHRQVCITVGGREKLVLAEAELRFYVVSDLASCVKDIRTQYPEPRKLTREICVEMGRKHPTYPGTKGDVVMTIDILLTIQEPSGELGLYPVHGKKREADLLEPGVLDNLEVSRRLWVERLERPWCLTTEEMVPEEVYLNALWLRRGYQMLSESTKGEDWYQHVYRTVANEMSRLPESGIGMVCDQVDTTFSFPVGSSQLAVQWKLLSAAKLPHLDSTLIPLRLCEFLSQFERTIQRGVRNVR